MARVRSPQLPHPHPQPPPSRDQLPLPWEPALTQLRSLSAAELDALVARWLTNLGLTAIRRSGKERRPTTYRAVLGEGQLSLPVEVRVHQRRNALQVHHVDAFLGHLHRRGDAAGLLVTTGSISPDAMKVAQLTRSPRVQLLSGPDWTVRLEQARAGLHRRSLRQLVVDLFRA